MSRSGERNAVPAIMRHWLSIMGIAALAILAACAHKEKIDMLGQGIGTFFYHQRNETTGILSSFINIDDGLLVDEAATYDLALAGLGFLELEDRDSAKRILDFFKNKWNPESGLNNFYNTKSGAPGVETTIHLGPNMWVAMLALHYTERTGDHTYLPLARSMALWAAKLDHVQDGVCMGPQEDWAGSWPDISSSENNIVAYSVFRFLYAREQDENAKEIFNAHMQGIQKFIRNVTLQKDAHGALTHVSVGCDRKDPVAVTSSCDVVTMLLLVFEPRELESLFGISERALLEFADKNFLVTTDGTEGYDFTDTASAGRIGRPRMISIEWTGQFACCYFSLARSSGGIANRGQRLQYQRKAERLIDAIDKTQIRDEAMVYYPYATKGSTQVFPFSTSWKTPAGDSGKTGAVSSTAWRLFAHKKFNPLELR